MNVQSNGRQTAGDLSSTRALLVNLTSPGGVCVCVCLCVCMYVYVYVCVGVHPSTQCGGACTAVSPEHDPPHVLWVQTTDSGLIVIYGLSC